VSLLAKLAGAARVSGTATSTSIEAPPLVAPASAPVLSTALPTRVGETLRIVALPRAEHAPGAVAEALHLPGAPIRLLPIQRQCVEAMHATATGLLAPIAAGRGKTIPALLAPLVLDCDFALVLTKAGIVAQMRRNYEGLRSSFAVRPIRIVSYDVLSRESSSRLLDQFVERFDPSRVVIVCDEAHCLADPKSTRTRRVLRFARANPAVRWVMLSGTLLKRSVADFAHLAELALRESSPVPSAGVYGTRSISHLDSWSACIDKDGRPAPEDWHTVAPLAAFAGVSLEGLRGEGKRSAIRGAFAERLRTAPGVVMSLGDEVEASLRLRLLEDPEPPPEVRKALATLDATGEDPGGEIHLDPLAIWRKARELSAGFYYRWKWPNGAVDEAWVDARRAWHGAVRKELEHRADVDHDSPLLVSRTVEADLARTAAGERVELRRVHRTWPVWKRERVKPEPSTEAVWISAYLVVDAIHRARASKLPAIVWYCSGAVEAYLRQHAGFPVYGSGDALPESPAHTCAASWKAHGTGRNLQAWSVSIWLELPDGGDAWEQLLARQHRTGQDADEVRALIYQHTESYQRNMREAERDARVVTEAMGAPVRLVYADREEIK
jgi:hypothetical protein